MFGEYPEDGQEEYEYRAESIFDSPALPSEHYYARMDYEDRISAQWDAYDEYKREHEDIEPPDITHTRIMYYGGRTWEVSIRTSWDTQFSEIDDDAWQYHLDILTDEAFNDDDDICVGVLDFPIVNCKYNLEPPF